MDVAYLVRMGEHNEELRYSLRSVDTNLAHDRVFVAGYKPRWVTGVTHLRTSQGSHKYHNAAMNLEAIAHTRGLNRFVLMNDDFFIMQKMGLIPEYNRGPLREQIDRHIRKLGATAKYVQSAQMTLEVLEEAGYKDPLSFSGHVPIVMEREILAKVMADFSVVDVARNRTVPSFLIRTLYGNVAEMWGESVVDSTVKVQHQGPLSESQLASPFLSTNDETFKHGKIGAHIRATFPRPSRYEVLSPSAQLRATFVPKQVNVGRVRRR